MNEIKIDNDIPIPPKAGRAISEKSILIQRTLLKLEAGQSFEIPTTRAASMRLMVSRLSKITDKTFSTRTTQNGIRVWRIESTKK